MRESRAVERAEYFDKKSIQRRSYAPIISVIICTKNRAEKLVQCLESLKLQTLPRSDFELVLVDDGSTDSTLPTMTQALQDFQGCLISHHNNRGLASAKNSAISAARGEFVLFMNDDTYASPQLLAEMVISLQQYKSVKGGVIGYIAWTPELQHQLLYHAMEEYNLYCPYKGMQENQPYNFNYFIGTNTAFPRSAFFETGEWFDETFYRYGAEDIELGYRLWRKGYQIYFNPRALMYHDHLMTVQDYRTRARENGSNVIQVLTKHPELVSQYFGENFITPQLLEQMRRGIERDCSSANAITAQLTDVATHSVGPVGAPLSQQHRELLGYFAQALAKLFKHDSQVAYLETLESHPEFRKALVIDSPLTLSQPRQGMER